MRTCVKCGNTFEASRSKSRHLSCATCRAQRDSCACGAPKRIASKQCKDCSRANQVGSNNGNYKGGARYHDSKGYITLIRDGKYIYEHRFVMQEHLHRELLSSETVHHKNGVKDDNRIENLELWSSSHPSGQRVTDKIAWAKDILGLYEPGSLAQVEPGQEVNDL